jgi:hypothetical protein
MLRSESNDSTTRVISFTVPEFASNLHETVKCQKEIQCKNPYNPSENYDMNEFHLNPFAISNNDLKILMEYTPKASCTSAVAMFFEAVGYRYGNEYIGWPQWFQESFYERHCGKTSHCMYLDNSWFRFKVVRNPYDRIVSSFLYILQNPPLYKSAVLPFIHQEMTFLQQGRKDILESELFAGSSISRSMSSAGRILTDTPGGAEGGDTGDNHEDEEIGFHIPHIFKRRHMTFERFVNWLEYVCIAEMQYYGDGHGGYQHQPYEIEAFLQGKSIWNEIIHAEQPTEALNRINKQFNFSMHLNYHSSHYAKRTNNKISHSTITDTTNNSSEEETKIEDKYVGNIPYSLLLNRIPNSYGYFYNNQLRRKVEKIFYWDIKLYNYSFPYQEMIMI